MEGVAVGELERSALAALDQLLMRYVALRVVWMLPYKYSTRRLHNIDAIIKQLDHTWRCQRLVGPIGAKFDGELLEAVIMQVSMVAGVWEAQCSSNSINDTPA